MKVNKKNIVLASVIGLTLVGTNLNLVSAQGLKSEPQGTCEQRHRDYRCVPRKNIFKDSVEQLEKEGVINSEDVKNIREYLREDRIKKEKEIINSKVDEIVKNKVITKEKGEKIKKSIQNNKGE